MIGNDGGRCGDAECVAAARVAASIATSEYGISIIDINKSMPIIGSNNR